jgi:hypothetical protein
MRKLLTSVLSISMAFGFLCLAVAPVTQASSKSEQSMDALAKAAGLRRLPDSVMDQAWVRPGAELGKYHAIIVMPVDLAYRSKPRASRNEFPLNHEQKRALNEVVPAALASELVELKGLELTNKRGRHVMVLETAVVDIVSHVPSEPVGRGASFVRILGEATIVIELRDSLTDEVVARAIERCQVTSNSVHRSNRVWNRSEVRHAAERMSANLRRQVEEFARM